MHNNVKNSELGIAAFQRKDQLLYEEKNLENSYWQSSVSFNSEADKSVFEDFLRNILVVLVNPANSFMGRREKTGQHSINSFSLQYNLKIFTIEK